MDLLMITVLGRLDHQQELSTIAIIEKSMLDIKSWMDTV